MEISQRPLDKEIYEREIAPWLPERIFDCHVHIGLPEHRGPISPERLKMDWAMEVGLSQSWQELRSAYEILFPDRQVQVLAFGGVFKEIDIEANNEYVLRGVLDAANNARGLCVTRPEWDAKRVSEAMERGFVGIKPYPDLAPQETREVSIYDFLPRSHLVALDERSGILMLHLPRGGRLADPENIREVMEIAENYPSIRIILAHIGRCFCLPTLEKSLHNFVQDNRIFFDTSANLNADVFHYALQMIGADRMLFGSDLPITLMRGMREHIGERYVNYTDGNYSWNTNRKSPEVEARYTYFLYEEIRALIRAVERAGLGRDALEKIMLLNAKRLIEED